MSVDLKEYDNNVIDLMNKNKNYYDDINKGYQNIEAYYKGHIDRIHNAIGMLNDNIVLEENAYVHEAGSIFPFMSLSLTYKANVYVEVSSIQNRPLRLTNFVYLRYGNLCYDDFGNEICDLIITTEVFEHLSCNLLIVRDKIIKSIKKGGYWFVSFPMNGRNASMSNYNKEWCNDEVVGKVGFSDYTERHLREFNEETVKQFLDISNMKIIANDKKTGWIHQFLLKKD